VESADLVAASVPGLAGGQGRLAGAGAGAGSAGYQTTLCEVQEKYKGITRERESARVLHCSCNR
jgi:hypothetical protein